jgi:6-phosphogluconate dehydrogenase (decarboxylating)
MPSCSSTRRIPARGQNLILNAADDGFNTVVFNRTVSKVDRFLENEAKGKRSTLHSNSKLVTDLDLGKPIIGTHSIEEFCAKLKKPRRIVLLVMAGPAVDDFIEKLLPYCDPGDIIIDGGHSHYPDSSTSTAASSIEDCHRGLPHKNPRLESCITAGRLPMSRALVFPALPTMMSTEYAPWKFESGAWSQRQPL